MSLAGYDAVINSARTTCTLVVATASDAGANITGAVRIVADSGAIVSLNDSWTYITEGRIDSVVPAAGQSGSRVTIDGVGLFGGGSGVAFVSFAGVAAFVVSATDTRAVVQVLDPIINGTTLSAPDDLVGDVVITSDTGVFLRVVDGWVYSSVGSVVPASGQRGTIVTIRGTALFAGGTTVSSVELGGVPVLSVAANSSDEIVVVARERSVSLSTSGAVTITMNNGQTVSLTSGFTYEPAGAMDQITPISGQQGTSIYIHGTNLLGHGASIVDAYAADVQVASIAFANNTYVHLVAGASGVTQGDVRLVADTGATVVLADGLARNALIGGEWIYVTPGDISSVSPVIGQVNTRVTITGTDLYGGGSSIVDVKLSNVSVTEIVSQSSSEVVVIAAAASAHNLCMYSELKSCGNLSCSNECLVLIESAIYYFCVCCTNF